MERKRTTTPPMSNRMAVGGLGVEGMAINFYYNTQNCYERIMGVCSTP